jgi:lipid A 3-O-deacylase
VSLRAAAQEQRMDEPAASDRKYFSYTYSNDFFNGTDRYFTQQIHPQLVFRIFRKMPLMKLLVGLKGSVRQYGLSGTQDCFTPASIRRDTILRGDRPYAGTMVIGHFKISNDQQRKRRLTSQLDIGVIGPCAKCEEEQKGIHRWLDNIQPLGWENQISNDLYLTYRLRYEKSIFGSPAFDAIALAEVNGGTIYDNAAIGLNLRTGRMQPYFEDARSRKLQFYFSAQGWIKALGYNGTLQGGMFSSSINTLSAREVAPVVLKGVLATGISFKWFSIEHGRVFITREINAWWPHGWGYINITTWF